MFTQELDLLGHTKQAFCLLQVLLIIAPNNMLTITSVSARSVFSRVRSLVTIPFWGEKEYEYIKHIKLHMHCPTAMEFVSSPQHHQRER